MSGGRFRRREPSPGVPWQAAANCRRIRRDQTKIKLKASVARQMILICFIFIREVSGDSPRPYKKSQNKSSILFALPIAKPGKIRYNTNRTRLFVP